MTRRTLRGSPLISHHRGGGETQPPGSLAAYADAVEQHAELVEFDVRRTLDGTLICAHDPTSTDGVVWGESRWDEIASGPSAPLLLEAVLRLADTRSGLHVDLKEAGYEAEVVRAVLAGSSPPRRIYFTSLDESTVQAIRSEFPAQVAALSLGRGFRYRRPLVSLRRVTADVLPFRRLARTGANAVAVNQWLLTPLLKYYCRRKGIQIMVWTVNGERRMRRLLRDRDLAVLITDRPLLATELRVAVTGTQ